MAVFCTAKSVWVFQRQHIGQGDQGPHTFHLLEQADLGVVFLGDLLDLPVDAAIRWLTDSISPNNGSKAARNSTLKPAARSGRTRCVPHLRSRSP